jgi:hypothetical protein
MLLNCNSIQSSIQIKDPVLQHQHQTDTCEAWWKWEKMILIDLLMVDMDINITTVNPHLAQQCQEISKVDFH